MKSRAISRGSILVVTVAAMMAFAAPAWADTTFVVNATGDEADAATDTVGDVDTGTDGDQCTLRAAIQEANATVGADTIHFDVGGGGAQTIDVAGSELTITDDDGEPALSIDDTTVTEGDAGTTDANFTVRLSGASGREVTVDYATDDGTARAGKDYETRGGRLTFAPGDTEKTVSVPVDGDTLNEDNENFLVGLSGAQGATISDNRAVGTITDDDAGTASNLSVGDVTVTEGNSGTVDAVFDVALSGASGRTVTVDYATSNNTARAASDYVARRGTLTFAPDETEKTVTVRVDGDALDEEDETFFLDLIDPSGATLADGRATGTITDDDTAPTVFSVSPKGRQVLPNENVTATFSEAMDQTTFDAATTFKLVRKGTTQPVAALISSPTPEEIVLDPNNALRRGETYRVIIVGGPNGVKDADGTALASNKIWEFTVR